MNNKVSNIQMGMLLSLVLCGFFLGMSDIMLLNKTSSDTFISMIIGSILGLVPIFMYLKINDTYKNLNIYEKINKLFGKITGTVINTLIFIIYITIFSISIRSIIIFATSKYLEVTPYLFVGTFIIICCFIAVFNKLETMLRLAQIAFVITIFIALFIETSAFKYLDVYNILPLFNNNILNIIYSSFYYAASSSLLSILLLSISKGNIKNNKKYNKTAIVFYLYAILSLTLVMFFIVSCFGYNMSSMFRYPEYIGLKKIGLSSSDLHLENLLAFRWIFYLLALACTSLYGMLTGISTYKIKKSKIITGIIAFIVMYLNKLSIPNTLVFIRKYYIPFIALPIFILLFIIFIKCIIKKESN